MEMMLLYFNKHIQNMEYSPLQILSSTSLSGIYSRCLVGGGLKACGGPTSKWLEVISLKFVGTYIIFQLLGDFRLVRCLHCNKLVRRGKVGCRHDICHKHHKQRLCKIISTRVKLHFVKVLLEQLLHVSFQFLEIFSHLNQ